VTVRIPVKDGKDCIYSLEVKRATCTRWWNKRKRINQRRKRGVLGFVYHSCSKILVYADVACTCVSITCSKIPIFGNHITREINPMNMPAEGFEACIPRQANNSA